MLLFLFWLFGFDRVSIRGNLKKTFLKKSRIRKYAVPEINVCVIHCVKKEPSSGNLMMPEKIGSL
jgi:hypothetical protein